jgi:hypothetical protein
MRNVTCPERSRSSVASASGIFALASSRAICDSKETIFFSALRSGLAGLADVRAVSTRLHVLAILPASRLALLRPPKASSPCALTMSCSEATAHSIAAYPCKGSSRQAGWSVVVVELETAVVTVELLELVLVEGNVTVEVKVRDVEVPPMVVVVDSKMDDVDVVELVLVVVVHMTQQGTVGSSWIVGIGWMIADPRMVGGCAR